MLVLSRKVCESLQIGSARVTIVRVTGGRVIIGIEAPEDVRVARTELPDSRAAVKTDPEAT